MNDQGDILTHHPSGGTQVSWLMPLAPREDPELLTTTLFTLARQSLQADELVIAADGTLPEALLEVIECCGLPCVLYRQEKQLGIGATLAKVAPLCKGDVIVRIDSDDLYAPEHTATIVAALEREPDLGAVGCQLQELDMDQGLQTSARRTPTNPQEARRWLPWRNPLNHQTVALRRAALIKAGGYCDCPGFEDWDLWFRINANGYKIKSLAMSTVVARVNYNHLQRRRGWQYVLQEYNFYRRQFMKSHVGFSICLAAMLVRLPWRVLPTSLLRWWMRSGLRGSPAIDRTWVPKLINQKSWPTGYRKEK